MKERFDQWDEKVFPYALKMAKECKGKLHLIFVARDLSYFKMMHVNPLALHDVAKEIANGGGKAMKEYHDPFAR